MQYRTLGQSDIKTPVVIVGAWAMGGWCWGGTDEEESVRAIQEAIDLGMNCVDTAPAYGFGLSEELLGKAIQGRRDDVIVATKCGLIWDREEGDFFFDADDNGKPLKVYKNLRPASIQQECEASLKRLGVETIDLYQCHWPDATTDISETMAALLDLQQQGKIRTIGVSNFTAEMMETCLGHGVIVSDQPRYSLLARDVEKDVLPFCREKNVGVITYSSLELGLLTGKVTMDRTFPESDIRSGDSFSPWFKLENRKKVLDALDRIQPIAASHGITLGQLAIAWVHHQPGVTAAIVGVRTAQQARENAAAGDVELSADELGRIDEAFSAIGEPS